MAAEPAPQVAAGLYQTKELLLLMDEDRNSKISKDEFMKFMAAEFDALDTNKDGELDVAELTGVRVRRSGPVSNHKQYRRSRRLHLRSLSEVPCRHLDPLPGSGRDIPHVDIAAAGYFCFARVYFDTASSFVAAAIWDGECLVAFPYTAQQAG